MKIYNQEKTQIIDNPDLNKGYLKPDQLVHHIEAQEEIKEQFHYRTIAEYENGGKDVEKVIDIQGRPAIEEHDEYEDIQVYVLYTQEELLEIEKDKLRAWREDYFKIIDRAAWYDSLTDDEKTEVKQFRQELLDITETLIKPSIPECIRRG